MADKKPLVAGQSPAVVQQIGSGDTLDVPTIKLGAPLAAQYGGLGVDASLWADGRVPQYNGVTGSFVPAIMPQAAGFAGQIQYAFGTGGVFASSSSFSFEAVTNTLNLYGELYVATGGSSINPRMQMFTFADKAGDAGVLRFRESALSTPIEFKFTGTAIETPGEFRAHRLSVTDNASITQLGDKTSSVVVHGSKFTIITSSASLAAGTSVSFTITNNAIQDTNAMIFVSHVYGGTLGAYGVSARAVGPNTASLSVRNNTSGALAQALILKGVVIG